MSSLIQRARRSFTAVAAGTTLAVAVGLAQAQAAPIYQFIQPPEGLPDNCLPFNKTKTLPAGPYNKVLEKVKAQLENYSGFKKIFDGAKAGGMNVEGLCVAPLPLTGGLTPFHERSRAFIINVQSPYTNDRPAPMKPEDVMEIIEGGTASYAASILAQLQAQSLASPSSPLYDLRHDFETLTLINTLVAAHAIAENILFAAEAAGDDKDNGSISYIYNVMPTRVQEISDLHAKALVAKAEGRSLTQAERDSFRMTITEIMMKDPQTRAKSAQASASLIGALTEDKLKNDIANGQPLALPVSEPYSAGKAKETTSALGNSAQLGRAIDSYKAYWDARAAEDPAQTYKQQLQELQQSMLDQARQYLRQQPSGATPRPR
ncbi:MAG: hypothetical protein ACK4NR_10875 [Micavibrio sp.]